MEIKSHFGIEDIPMVLNLFVLVGLPLEQMLILILHGDLTLVMLRQHGSNMLKLTCLPVQNM